METITISVFKVESEAYEALSKMRNHASYQETLKFSQVALVKKSNGSVHWKDGFDTGVVTQDDTWKGTLIGGLVGVLGGPLGILLGMGVGTLAGAAKDSYDAKGEGSVVRYVSSRMEEGDVAIIAVIEEENEVLFDRMLDKFDVVTVRYNPEAVEKEVEHAKEVEKKLQKQAEEEMMK
ncbi:DUF1269 domain-containing protein [Oceanobacillus piezotolerans]|uniref:DUF1269 domain-containing protein n=1 Tax=Oceanobacillus piezotolerans TaxID=2448030 RepID=A0A498DEI9_9BACI|nr:DUF1269 domain-containing protein [Oceanobacillus piezotolerans]RLL41799.1 DUF1269 domain-containing protein [Oceanobacillus piezotolerans]